MPPSATTAATLKAWALEEGFDRAGIALLSKSVHGEVYRRWIERGDHAAMAWMDGRYDVREDPALLLPGARSALCVALQYHPLDGEPEAEGDLWPRVARYARGRDYHDILGKALKRLAARIRDAYPGAETRPYVDTGPILERELAARAGLGYFGKNTNLLHPRWGSYFLLGELLLTLELDPDAPTRDICGTCTRCLDACPTGALPEPYRLDARRCISYWTIEHRGDFPPQARALVDDWVFGCDICQEVCPHNGKALPGKHPRLRMPPERRELDLAGLLGLDREEYVRRFIRSPMKRAKLEGLQRNAAVAMVHRVKSGQDTAERYIPALTRALRENPDAMVRRHAAWALGQLGGAEALDAARAVEEDESVRLEIDAALARARGTELDSSTGG